MAGGSWSVAPEAAPRGVSHQPATNAPIPHENVLAGERRLLARTSTALEGGTPRNGQRGGLCVAAQPRGATVLGVTGREGSGKPFLADELGRDLDHEGTSRPAVHAVRPTRRRAGGALLRGALAPRMTIATGGQD